jgi:hypothetical protein
MSKWMPITDKEELELRELITLTHTKCDGNQEIKFSLDTYQYEILFEFMKKLKNLSKYDYQNTDSMIRHRKEGWEAGKKFQKENPNI